MSALDIEVGKDGLEVEAKGTVILVIASLAFIGGLAIGGYLGYKLGSKIHKKND